MALQAFGPANETAPAPSLIGSLQAGAALGTQLRGQDIAQNEAKDRLSLAYAQLQSQEERAAEQAQAKLTLAHATLTARQQQQDLMAGYREQALKQQEERNQALSDAASKMADYRERALTLRQQLGGADGPKLHFGTEGEVLKQNPDGTVTEVRPRQTKANVKFDVASGKWFRVTPEGGVEEVAPKEIPKPPAAPPAPGVIDKIRSMFSGSAPPSLQIPKSAGGGNRVKVVGPDGQKGTVPEGTDLPDGWKLAQ